LLRFTKTGALDHRHDELVDGNTTSDQWFFNSLLGPVHAKCAPTPGPAGDLRKGPPSALQMLAVAAATLRFAP
jgi:hypothetical protein